MALCLAVAFSTNAAVLHVPADYPTIQAAVHAAASGDAIRIAAGTYTEQVLVTAKNLRFVGVPGTVLKAQPAMIQTLPPAGNVIPAGAGILAVHLAEVTVKDITFDGARLGDANAQVGGIVGVWLNGSSAHVEHCSFTGFRGDPSVAGGSGISTGNLVVFGTPVVEITVNGCTFADNGTAMDLEGDTFANSPTPRTVIDIQDNTITGVDPSDPQNPGIQILPAVTGRVKGNLIQHAAWGVLALDVYGYSASPPSPEPLQAVSYEANKFVDDGYGLISAKAHGSRFVNNRFDRSNVGLASSGTGDQIINNRFADSSAGIVLLGDDPTFGTALGTAGEATLIGNGFCQVADPIVTEPLVTGTVEHGSRLNDCQDQNGGHH